MGTLTADANRGIGGVTQPVSEISVVKDQDFQHLVGNADSEYELPRMPPWFVNIGGQKLYVALAGILRLSGLSIMAGNRSDVSLSVLVDILIEYFHQMIAELRIRDYKKDGWLAWYICGCSGQLLRHTSSVICMLNEIMYGPSDVSVGLYSQLFGKAGSQVGKT